MDREDVIRRVVEEKGIEAIPQLIELLEDEDPQLKDLAFEVLETLSEEGKDIIFEEFKRIFEKNEKDNVVLLYLADLLATVEYKKAISYIERLLDMFTDPRALPLIYEYLLRLTKSEKYVDILSTYLDEEEEMMELAIMALGQVPLEKSLNLLKEKYFRINDKSAKALILDSIQKIILSKPEYMNLLERDREGKEIIEKIGWGIK